MPTECNAELFGFAAIGRREVVAGFDGGSITSDAGALLLGAADQVIGYVGQTGDVASPQLHFEIRSATTRVNPHSYLSAATASN